MRCPCLKFFDALRVTVELGLDDIVEAPFDTGKTYIHTLFQTVNLAIDFAIDFGAQFRAYILALLLYQPG